MMLTGSLKFPMTSPQITVLIEKLHTPLMMDERSNEQMVDVALRGLAVLYINYNMHYPLALIVLKPFLNFLALYKCMHNGIGKKLRKATN